MTNTGERFEGIEGIRHFSPMILHEHSRQARNRLGLPGSETTRPDCGLDFLFWDFLHELRRIREGK